VGLIGAVYSYTKRIERWRPTLSVADSGESQLSDRVSSNQHGQESVTPSHESDFSVGRSSCLARFLKLREKRRDLHGACMNGGKEPEVRATNHIFRRVFILLFLVVQLSVPAGYYLWHDNPMDERFAWRMFSPIRIGGCKVKAYRDTQPVALGREVHVVWGNLLRRGRLDVARGVARHLCQTSTDRRVRLEISCTQPDGSVWQPFPPELNLCETTI